MSDNNQVKIDITADVQGFNSNMASAQANLDRTAKAFNQTGDAAQQANKHLGAAEDSAGRLGGVLKDLAIKVAGVFVGWKAAEYIKDMALLNARYETLGISMTVVGKNAGYSASQMESSALAMQATGISMIESRQQAMRLVQAHIDLSESTKLARIAQDAAVIGNMNSSEAFAAMIHGIQTGQTDVLRTIGLNISMEQSYKLMAQQLHKSVDALTENEKTQGVLNAVLLAGTDIAGTYEAAMGTAGKQINSMTRYTEDLKVKQGEVFNEVLTVAVMAYTEHLKDANGELDEMSKNEELKQWGEDVADIFAMLADNVSNLAGAMQIVGKTLGFFMARNNSVLNADQLQAMNDAYGKDIADILSKEDRFARALEDRRKAQQEKRAADVTATKAHGEQINSIMRFYADQRVQGLMTEEAYLKTVTAIQNQDVGDHHQYKDTPAVQKGKALAEYQNAIAIAQAKVEKDGIDRSLRVIDDGLKDYYVSYESYYQAKAALQNREIDNEETRIRREIANEQKAVTSATGDEKYAALSKIKQLQADLTIQEQKRWDVGVDGARALTAAYAKMGSDILGIEADIAEVTGRTGDATVVRLAKQYGDLIKQLEANGETGAAERVRTLLGLKYFKSESDNLQKSYGDEMTAMADSEKRIQIEQQAGILTEYEARQRIVVLHRQTIPLLETQIPLMEAMAKATNNVDEQRRIERLKTDLLALKATTSDVTRSFEYGMSSALGAYQDEVTNTAQQTNRVLSNSFRNLEDVFVKTFTTGKFAANDFFSALEADIARMYTQREITGPLFNALFGSAAGGGIVGQLSGQVSTGMEYGINPFSDQASQLAAQWNPTHHTGYGPGDPMSSGRYVHPAYFENAPRFHTGIGAGERPAIIRNDEAVLTPGQMRMLSPAGAAMQSLRVEIVNQGGAPQQVVSAQPSFDGKGMVVSIVLDDFRRGGPISSGIKNMTQPGY